MVIVPLRTAGSAWVGNAEVLVCSKMDSRRYLFCRLIQGRTSCKPRWDYIFLHYKARRDFPAVRSFVEIYLPIVS